MNNNIDQLIRVSELYYEEGLSQQEISRIMDVSRPAVSRMLTEARDCGIVEIKVNSPIRKNAELSKRIREVFGLRDVIVVKGSYSYERGLHRCCEAAVDYSSTILTNGMTIGTAWGMVPRYLCELFNERRDDFKYYNIDVVQMVGCLGAGNPEMDGVEIALRLARSLGGMYYNIYAPVYVSSKPLYDSIMEEPLTRATLRRAQQVDVTYMGIGSYDDTTSLQRAGYLNDNSRRELIAAGAAGHMLARPYDKDGNEIQMKGRYVVGAPLETMHKVSLSIGISAAAFKATAVYSAIKGGYINVLIIDEPLASALLELAESGGES
jgi:deoxyribonucleoside regulator